MKDRATGFSWIRSRIRRCIPGILLLCAVNGLSAAASVFSALLFKEVVDGAVSGALRVFLAGAALYGGILAAQTACYALDYWLRERIAVRMENQIRMALYRTVLRSDYASVSAWHTGELNNHLNGDVGIISSSLITIFPRLASMLVSLIGAFGVLLFLNWRFALCLALLGGVFLFSSTIFRRITRRLHREVQKQYDLFLSFLQETAQHLLIIRAFCAEDRAARLFGERLSFLQAARMKRNHFSNFCATSLDLAVNAGYLLGLIWCGIGIIDGRMTYGTLAAVLQLIRQIQSPFANISSLIPQYYAMTASIDRLRVLEDLPPEPIPPDETTREARESLARFESLHARGLSFSYDRLPVFENACLDIRRGDFVAFTGVSGIGKSTFLKLLLAVYLPETGSVGITGADGICYPVSPATRFLFSYVPQGNFLLSGTIYETVAFLCEDRELTDEKKAAIRHACGIACADEFIREMPDGYDTVIGERGAGLSEGQAQRLAIARAIATGAPVLLLDEATSALDEDTERRILDHLRTLSGRTVLIVTHRKKALAICNRIVEIRERRIRELTATASPDAGTEETAPHPEEK